MSSLSRFLPSRKRVSTTSDGPEVDRSAASHSEKESQDNKSLSSAKDDTKVGVEEADLVSPGALTLEEGMFLTRLIESN